MTGRLDLRLWRTVRRYAVPRWMIEQATSCRLAGDWRGACDAAGVDGPDLARVRREHGAAVAGRVEDDLLHLAPDLLRWHLFRAFPALTPLPATVALTVYGRPALHVRPKHPGTPSPRLELVVDALGGDQRLSLADARERWDSRCAPGLLARCGGYDGHLPGFTVTGDRLPEPSWTDRERILAAQDAGDWALAWSLAGFDVEPLLAEVRRGHWIESLLRAGRYDLPELRAAAGARRGPFVARPGAQYGPPLLIDADLRVWHRSGPVTPPELPAVRVERPVDFDLVRHGMLPLEQLHPLVGDALFPGLAGLFEGPPAAVPDLSPVRVRCQGEWHVLGDHHHSAEETRRELTLRALGGAPLRGCFAARAGWRHTDAWTPKVLRQRRREIVERAVHGDGPALVAWLDAGLDPHLRDQRDRTLLHLIAWLPDPGPVMARLRHAGIDPQARDRDGRTPLEHALAEGGSPAAVAALRALADGLPWPA